jgi:hypothetical protein
MLEKWRQVAKETSKCPKRIQLSRCISGEELQRGEIFAHKLKKGIPLCTGASTSIALGRRLRYAGRRPQNRGRRR